MIPFNKPPVTGDELMHLQNAMESGKLSGDGFYGNKCQDWFEVDLGCERALLTPSCTHALEVAALLIDIQVGDEVIMPSYTFVSTANAFALRGAKIVFIDVRPDTMNMDETLIEAAITSRTKAIVPVHYAGVACEMDKILEIANRYGIVVVEDAAQGMMSSYRERKLGTLGHLAAFSFHETKNYTSGGEGGLLIINDSRYIQKAEIIREKGTNRSQFFRGQVDKYSWVGLGSSYLPSELQAAYLWAQLVNVHQINEFRLNIWNKYYEAFSDMASATEVELPVIPAYVNHNAHMFYMKLASLEQRGKFIERLKEDQVMAVFHYVPLHSSIAGKEFGRLFGEDRYTTSESERLVRLPMYYGLSDSEQNRVISSVRSFFLEHS